MTGKKSVLILCTGNSARSQMAEGLLKHICQDEYTVHSAGTRPSTVRPEAIKALDELGIDISGNRSKSVDEFTGTEIDFVLTVCSNASETCPHFQAKTKITHKAFDDPADFAGSEKMRLEEFRGIRDKLKVYLESEFIEILKE